MATYAIGDIQGCFKPLQALLESIRFNPDKDQLWLCGDLVNRGPESLATLEFCHQRRDNMVCVLGNHDLHLLAVLLGYTQAKPKDTFTEVLTSPARDRLTQWLLSWPLLHENDQWLLVHAGIYPEWNLQQARRHAREVEGVLKTPELHTEFFNNMYGNTPAQWQEGLTNPERWRFITNCFTRMRLVDSECRIDLDHKESLSNAPQGLIPWYSWPRPSALEKKVLFGHWAALEGRIACDNVVALDTGCVWGNRLSAYCLESGQWWQVDCDSCKKF